ncbi:MAG: (2Fe-2S)-binding protein [Spirochaetaceae bacterium]|nr:MAG: (2Fe-2S)-binding protein [Spirochaetaceae bacterium]
MKAITFEINGRRYEREVPEYKTLLHYLREDLGFTGTKEGCGAGECGACTLIMNGKPVNSCLVLAVEADGAVIETIEGEAREGKLTIVQKSFDEHHAVQCGFCTGGMIMSVKDLLRRNSSPERAEVIEGIEGNFCRCTGYEQIIEAVLDAAGRGAAEEIRQRDAAASSKKGGRDV